MLLVPAVGRVYVLSLLAACGSLSPPPLAEDVARSDLNLPQCAVKLDPSPELYALTLDAAVRWQIATGCAVELGAGGIPLSFRENTGCGRTIGTGRTPERHHASAVEFRIDRSDCASIEHSVPHEVGHVLCLSGPEYADDGCHTGSGLMRGGGTERGSLSIDAESLAAVCAVARCPQFEPEE